MENIFQLFVSRFRFVVCASLLYEILVVMYASALVPILGFDGYGLLGSVLSIVHMSAHFADFGMTNSITPHLHFFLKDKQSFRTLFFWYTMVPHLPIIICIALGGMFVCSQTILPLNPALRIIIFFSIVFEAMQSFIRQFLYALLDYSVIVASIELGLLVIRLAVMWGVWFFTPLFFSSHFILCTHFLSASLCLFLFFLLLYRRYYDLPNNDARSLPCNLGLRIFSVRITSYCLRISRNFFSVHFLTPLFAIRFGLKVAGIFFFASKFAKMVQSVVKLAVGYSGNALFARVKNESFLIKQATFTFLLERLIELVGLFFFVFIVLVAGALYCDFLHQASFQVVGLSILFLVITCFEFFFTLYEQWYIAEESAYLLIPARVFELLMLFGVISSGSLMPVHLLLLLLLTRSIHLGMVVVQSYARWKICIALTFGFRAYCVFVTLLIGVCYLAFQGIRVC